MWCSEQKYHRSSFFSNLPVNGVRPQRMRAIVDMAKCYMTKFKSNSEKNSRLVLPFSRLLIYACRSSAETAPKMMSISSKLLFLVSGIRLRRVSRWINVRPTQMVNSNTYKEKVPIAPMLTVANMIKSFHPKLVSICKVTFETTKSRTHHQERTTVVYVNLLHNHWEALATARP